MINYFYCSLVPWSLMVDHRSLEAHVRALLKTAWEKFHDLKRVWRSAARLLSFSIKTIAMSGGNRVLGNSTFDATYYTSHGRPYLGLDPLSIHVRRCSKVRIFPEPPNKDMMTAYGQQRGLSLTNLGKRGKE